MVKYDYQPKNMFKMKYNFSLELLSVNVFR